MRKLFILISISTYILCGAALFAQKPTDKKPVSNVWDHLDTRVDGMEYWMEMAERGLTPYNPAVTIPPAVYRGTAIRAQGVRTTNSPDVPVTSATNVTESENSVFVDPSNPNYVLNSNNSTSWTGSTVGTLYGANYFQTSNAGIAWVGSANGAGGNNSGDPTTAINLSGRQFVNYISSASGQGIAYSDNGTTWTTATVAPNPGSLADKNHMWIDNKPTSPYVGNLYVAWTDFGETDDTEIKISRSTNNGVSWSTPLLISAAVNAGSHNQGVNIQTGPNGEVYVCWTIYDSWPSDETAIGFAKSTDGGVTFSAATRVITNLKGIRTTGAGKNQRVNSFPTMAVDISGGANNGNIYIAWTNIGTPGVNTGTNKSVYMIKSTNGGTTWASPVRVNQGTFVDGKGAYLPWICCDPVTGVLCAVYYDDRNVSSTQNEVFSGYSTDGGATWTDFVVSDVAFTPTPITGLASSYMGDYIGITARGGKVYPCWIDTRNSLFMTYVSPYELGLKADFRGVPSTICTGGSVTFTDLSTGPPSTWTWSFPGGTPSSYVGQTPPAITYSAPGSYNVSLTVTDATGSNTETKTGYITVKNVIADFTGTPTNVIVGNSVTFTDASSCSPGTWTWSFPGGTPSSYVGQTPPAITYSTLGTYDVSLTVTKAASTDTKTKTGYITVSPPVFNMTNGTVYTCTGDFYDSGGSAANYVDNETYIETFYPATTGSTLRFNFTSFVTELGYDTLTIYDGPSTASTLIGKYHGTTGPGIVTASNASGALTFRFHSDVSLNYAGWAATINCVAGFVGNPATFTATAASSSQINLAWTKNAASNDVMIVWAPTNTFGTPIDGTVYTVGGSVAGGGTVLYRGPLTAFNHTGLLPSTTYYYKAYSYSGVNTYSGGLSANAATFCGVGTLPMTQNFPTSTLPNCWTKQISGTGAIDKWTVSNTANAGGAAYEMLSTWQNINPATTRLVTPPINTLGISKLNLSFKHFIDAYGIGCTFRIQSSTDGVTWTNEAWSVASTATNVGPETVNTTVLSNINSPTTFIAFVIDGNLYQYDYWYIDDVSVTAGCATYYPASVSVSASGNNICAGTPVTFTATPVNGGSTPAYQWQVNATNASNATNATYTYAPANGDAVTCIMTSSAFCASGSPATSNVINMTVSPVVSAGISIAASANPVDAGTTVTFTATPVNGGGAPAYQWKVNGANVGTNSSTYSYVPLNGDAVTCVMTSNAACVVLATVTSNIITMTVNSVPLTLSLQNITVTGTQCFNAAQTINVAGGGNTFTVTSAGNATLIAGQNIIFNPGTTVAPGGYMDAYIAPGGPWCIAPTKPVTTTPAPAITKAASFFRVYPNPTSGHITLALNGYVPTQPVQVEIFGMNGEKVATASFVDVLKHEFDLTNLPSGLYLLKVDTGTESSTARVVKTE